MRRNGDSSPSRWSASASCCGPASMTGAKGCADVAAPPELAASQCVHTPGMARRRGCRRRGSLRRPPGRPRRRARREHAQEHRCPTLTSSRLRAAVLAIAASLLAGCATERSDGAPCPPVVAYSREFLARAAGELDSLSPGSAIEQMLADYQVMRDQARACERFGE